MNPDDPGSPFASHEQALGNLFERVARVVHHHGG